MIRDLRFTNELRTRHVRVLEQARERARDLAAIRLQSEEMALTRKRIEANGSDLRSRLKRGDEVYHIRIMGGCHAWEQRVRVPASLKRSPYRFRRRGRYWSAIPRACSAHESSRTNITNLRANHAVRRIGDLARPSGSKFRRRATRSSTSLSAPSLAAIITDSRHNWLLARSDGFLYVKKEKQRQLWPWMAAARTDAKSEVRELRHYPPRTTTPSPPRSVSPRDRLERTSPAPVSARTMGEAAVAERSRVKVLTPLDDRQRARRALSGRGNDNVKLGEWMMAKIERQHAITQSSAAFESSQSIHAITDRRVLDKVRKQKTASRTLQQRVNKRDLSLHRSRDAFSRLFGRAEGSDRPRICWRLHPQMEPAHPRAILLPVGLSAWSTTPWQSRHTASIWIAIGLLSAHVRRTIALSV